MVNSPLPVHRRRYSQEFAKQEQPLHFNRFQSVTKIMDSENGTIFEAVDSRTNETVILKKIKIEENSQVPTEIRLHNAAYKAAPEYVVKPLNYYFDQGHFWLALEKPDGYQDLLQVAVNYAPIDEQSVFKIGKQIATACNLLKDAEIVHGDIKVDNVLMNLKTLHIKLIDFGSARAITDTSAPNGTPRYYPTEYFDSRVYNYEDFTTWSVGAILYILLVGEWCWDEDELEWFRDNESEVHLSPNAISLIDQTLTRNRLSPVALLSLLTRLSE